MFVDAEDEVRCALGRVNMTAMITQTLMTGNPPGARIGSAPPDKHLSIPGVGLMAELTGVDSTALHPCPGVAIC